MCENIKEGLCAFDKKECKNQCGGKLRITKEQVEANKETRSLICGVKSDKITW